VSDSATEITAEHIERFQTRADRHFRISYALLAVICALFAFAIYVFSFAQDIDRRKGSVEVLQELHIAKDGQGLIVKSAEVELEVRKRELESGVVSSPTDLLGATIALVEAQTKLRLIEAQERLMIETGYVPDIETPRSKEELAIAAEGKKQVEDQLKSHLELVRKQFEEGFAGRTAVIGIERVVTQRTLDREVVEERSKFAPLAAQIKTTTSNLDTIELVRTSLIRFGGVAVTLFLISLLTPIYRYNVRLGTFYLARADTLILARDTKVQNFGELIRLLTPAYAFEKEPTTPVDSVASFLKEAGGLVRKA
jgi:hypothetical protein